MGLIVLWVSPKAGPGILRHVSIGNERDMIALSKAAGDRFIDRRYFDVEVDDMHEAKRLADKYAKNNKRRRE